MIYFLRCERDSDSLKAGWIKIGTTIRLSERLKQIAADIGHTPTVLAVLDGAFAEERALHGKFEFDRKSGEWFYPGSGLLRLIETEGKPWDGAEEVTFRIMRVDPDVLAMAKKAASLMEVSLADYASDVLRKAAERDLEREAKKFTKGSKE